MNRAPNSEFGKRHARVRCRSHRRSTVARPRGGWCLPPWQERGLFRWRLCPAAGSWHPVRASCTAWQTDSSGDRGRSVRDAAAYALSHRFDVTVFEARNHLGGTRTHAMSPQGSLDVSWATAVKVPSTGSRSSPRSATGVSRMCAWSSAMD
ncbi:NAD(P)-binding protein [Streptomyces sp. NPDC058200]